ncbi:MAG: SDR family oxidoreductase [Chitinophagales bacterium]
MFQPNLFKDKNIFITGGGSGIGYVMAKQFLNLGANVAIASRKQERIDKASAELREFGNCYGTTLDIREEDESARVADEIKKEFGTLDILINNAGGQFPSAAKDITPNGWRAVINNNLNGTFLVTQTMANKFFIPQKSGNIINIIAEIYRGFPGMAHTGAARAGVDNLTKSLSIEWITYGIRVNAIAPGIIKSSGLEQYPEQFLKAIYERIPMKRMGTMEEVGWMAVFLASPMASFITGETVYVDGGQRLWGDAWEIK